jgi:tetratricopeptide (TPR) repeat protein
MRTWIASVFCLLLAACASTPPVVQAPQHLFRDQLFDAPSERIGADDVFALSDAMKRFIATDIVRIARNKSVREGLIDALYKPGQLRLEYDAAMTRNAAQAFDARAGNCLSLVIMTAAFAKELGLPIHFNSAYTEETWSRSGNLLMRSGHVNVTLGRRLIEIQTLNDLDSLTIDFLPPEELRGLRTREIDEATVVAMYLNNRAAEALVRGRIDDAYAWARAAVERSPAFLAAYNTLGVIYLRRGDLAAAEQVFDYVLARAPTDAPALSNLAQVLQRQGRVAEAAALDRQLQRIEPYPPFYYFDLGQAAMRRDDFETAREMFAKEVARADYHHEFHFWLGVASFKLGDLEQARKHLNLALQNSTTRSDRDLYAAKLDWLTSYKRR